MKYTTGPSKREQGKFDVYDEDDKVKNKTPFDTIAQAKAFAASLEANSGKSFEELLADFVEMSTGKAIDPKVGGGVDRDKIPAEDFAGPNRTYPIVKPGDVSDAASLVGKADNPDAVKAKIISIAKRMGKAFVAELPEKWKEEEGLKSTDVLNLSYAKSLGLATLPDLAAKFTARNEIKHYAYIWGDPNHVDIDIEFFTPASEFWTSKNTVDIPLTWDHAQDKRFNDLEPDPRIGKTVEWGNDEYGKWAISVLDTDKKYRRYVDEFVEEKAVGYSSDSTQQYIQREKQGKGTWLKRWPWIGGALTPAPCEPRMKERSPEFLKSIGFTIPETHDIKQAWEWEKARLNILEIQSHI